MDWDEGLISDAELFATECHFGVDRKYGCGPFINHPRRAADRVRTLPGATSAMVAAEWLHDVSEDCGVSAATLHRRFGFEVARLVVELTNIKEPGLSRAAQKRLDHARLAKVSPEAKRMKLIDRIDNLNELPRGDDFWRVYAAESRDLADAIGDADAGLKAELLAILDGSE
jgi:(p)ppGpp synthase/HD superfamily hydrolase